MLSRTPRALVPPDQNLLDRVLGWLAPSWGRDRLKARAEISGYKGGRRDRRATRRWRPWGGSANADTLLDLPDLRARSRDLARNAPIATGAIGTVTTNVVGAGIRLNATADARFLGLDDEAARAWNEAAEREWALFSRTADWTGVQSFEEMQALAFRAVLESGDLVVIRHNRREPGDVYGLKLQLIEADRIGNPTGTSDSETMADGIESDATGRRLAVHIADRHPGALHRTAAAQFTRVPFASPNSRNRLVLHLFDRLRPDQARGVPYLAPIVTALRELDDYADAELRAAVIAAMFTVFVKQGDGDSASPIVGTTEAAAGVNDATKEIALQDRGAIVELDMGQDVEIANPGRPNPQFEAFVEAFLRQIGVALELPFELLIKHFTASYSASRAALEMAWQFFRRRRSWLARALLQPTYEWVIDEAVARGRLAAPGYFADPAIRAAYCRAEWIGPARPSLDPKKDAEADEIDIANRVKSRSQVCTERTGGEFDAKIEQLAYEDAVIAAKLAPAPAPAAGPRRAASDDDDSDREESDEE